MGLVTKLKEVPGGLADKIREAHQAGSDKSRQIINSISPLRDTGLLELVFKPSYAYCKEFVKGFYESLRTD